MFRQKRKANDFGAEIEAHLQLEADRLREQGLSEAAAQTAARRSFGNVTRARERFYESGRWLWWDHLWQDVRYGARMLRKAPGFTAIAVMTIAIGIGATTAIFSVVDATLLHPLPYREPEQLVSIVDDLPGVGAQDVGMSVPELKDLQASGIFEYVSPIGGGDVNLTGSSEPIRIRFRGIAPNYFALLGAKAQLGRVFDPEDHTPGFNLEAVISDGLWKRAYASDPKILGKSIRLDNDLNPSPLIVEGRDTPVSEAPLVGRSIVTPEYFHLLGMTLLRGRLLSEADNETGAHVAVVNDAFVRTYWPNADALGEHIKLDPAHAYWTTIVGVIADARTESLAEAAVPQVYLSACQKTPKDLAILLRGRLDPAAIPVQLREQVQAVDPELPVFGAQTLSDTVTASLAERRFAMEMVALFAVTALLLAGLGIYGVISFIVSERAHEIGIRLALGAQRRNVLEMVLQQGLRLAVAGAAAGLVGALIVSHLMAGLLYGVRPTDPATFAGVALLLVGVALLACYVPARRATKVDPMSTLREA
jgi:MacB-like periplasmic core domain/FtsX-like permease family